MWESLIQSPMAQVSVFFIEEFQGAIHFGEVINRCFRRPEVGLHVTSIIRDRCFAIAPFFLHQYLPYLSGYVSFGTSVHD